MSKNFGGVIPETPPLNTALYRTTFKLYRTTRYYCKAAGAAPVNVSLDRTGVT